MARTKMQRLISYSLTDNFGSVSEIKRTHSERIKRSYEKKNEKGLSFEKHSSIEVVNILREKKEERLLDILDQMIKEVEKEEASHEELNEIQKYIFGKLRIFLCKNLDNNGDYKKLLNEEHIHELETNPINDLIIILYDKLEEEKKLIEEGCYLED